MENKNLNKMKNSFGLQLYTLSPVHIGDGLELEPFSYVIKDNILYCFDMVKLGELLSENQRKQLMQNIFNPGEKSILLVRKYLAELFNADTHKEAVLYSYKIEQKGIINFYESRLTDKLQKEVNKLGIKTVYRDYNNKAIIPGSSLKGSLRHAFIKHNNLESIEKDIKINDDPFKNIIISDTSRDKETGIELGFVYNMLKDKLEVANTIYYLSEFIKPRQLFKFQVTVNNILTDKKENQDYINNINNTFKDYKSLLKMLNDYYGEKFEKQYSIIKQAEPEHPFIKNVDEIKGKLKNNVAFIHIGKYGGQEVLEGIKSKDIKYKKYKSTYLIKDEKDLYPNQIMPIGWVAVFY